MPSPSRRTLRRGLVAVAVLALVIGGAVAYLLVHAPGNVSHPGVDFTTTTTTVKRAPPPVDDFEWPTFGYDLARTRYFPARIGPPFRVGWRYQDYALLEFPPVMYHAVLFDLDDDGSVKAIDATNGHLYWQTKVGTLAAASPAYDAQAGLVYAPLLSVNGEAPGNGRFVALSMNTGHVAWSRPLPAGGESSPLEWNSTVYFGDQSGTVYALNARTGQTVWTYHAEGAVKGGVTFSGGNLYFGDYDGRVYSLNARTGHQNWAVTTNGAELGFGSGNFYSSAAVAFGRVYLGNTDGYVYSFSARTGQLAWSTGTGAYVYSSPAVENTPGLGPTVYIGSYDGNVYAFNAQSGAIRWTHEAGGKISGSPIIIGNVVYYSDLATRTSAGLDPRTGRQVFSFPAGVFNPAVSDGHALYFIGYSMLYQLLPDSASPAKPATPAKRPPAARRTASKNRN